MIDAVLRFWFDDTPHRQRFAHDASFDQLIGHRFGGLLRSAREGLLDDWAVTPDGALALVVVLDQFSRNIHRGHPQAFAADGKAREIASAALARGFDRLLPPERRAFLYLPFEHSESLADQERSLALFTAMRDGEQLDHAVRHHAIVERFGRFPHRNAILGRTSTPEEIAFLTLPESAF